MPNYSLRPVFPNPDLPGSDDFEASSSQAPSSSPEYPLPPSNFPNGRFNDLDFLEEDPEDLLFVPAGDERTRTSADQKAIEVLQFMKRKYDCFSLRKLEAVFSENSSIPLKEYAGVFRRDGGVLWFMERLYEVGGGLADDMLSGEESRSNLCEGGIWHH